jgi:hypothetical protein
MLERSPGRAKKLHLASEIPRLMAAFGRCGGTAKAIRAPMPATAAGQGARLSRAQPPLETISQFPGQNSDNGSIHAFQKAQAKARQVLPPREPCELRLRRIKRGGAEAAQLVLLIRLEVALEPFDVAVALERENVRRQPVQEEAIMADDHRAAGEIL